MPAVFKNQIGKTLLNKVNDSLNAKIDYADYQLSLIKSFPDFTATFTDFSIVGKNQFENDTLAFLQHFSTTIDIMSLIKKDGIVIKKLSFNNALLNMIVAEDGIVNYDLEKHNSPNDKDLIKSSVQPDKVANESSNSVRFLLADIALQDVSLSYINRKSNYRFSALDINGAMSGYLENMMTLLDFSLSSSSISYIYDSVAYLNKATLNFESRLVANLSTYEFTFLEGETKVNDMPFVVNGGFSMPNDSIIFDVNFDVPDISIDKVLNALQSSYGKLDGNIQAEGNVKFGGVIKGIYYNNILPLIDINFNVTDGKLKYPQLPDEITISELNASVKKPEGSINELEVGISNMQMLLANNPLSMHAKFSSIFEDPYLDVALDGKVDLGTITKVFPIGDATITGMMTADASVLGNYSALKANNFTSFISKGSVDLSNFYLQSKSIPQGLHLKNAAMVLKDQDVQITGMQGNIGRSDFSVQGKMQRLVSYLFANDILTGNFQLNSRLIDANEFMKRSKYKGVDASSKSDSIEDELEPLTFPKDVHLIFDANINHLLFDQMNITKFAGSLELKNQELNLSNLSMQMLDGKLGMNGKIVADGRKNPDVTFKLDVDGFDLPSAHRDLSIIQKYLPVAAKSEGEFSTLMNVKSMLSGDLKMIVSTISANGTFSTHNVKINDPQLLYGLKSVIQTQKFNNLTVDDFTTTFSIENGNLELKPLKTKLSGQPIQLSGVYNLGGTLNFRVDASLDKAILSNDIQAMIAYIPGSQTLKKVDVGMDISGDAKKPDVKLDTDKIRQQVLNQLKNSSKEDLENAAKNLLRQLFK